MHKKFVSLPETIMVLTANIYARFMAPMSSLPVIFNHRTPVSRAQIMVLFQDLPISSMAARSVVVLRSKYVKYRTSWRGQRKLPRGEVRT